VCSKVACDNFNVINKDDDDDDDDDYAGLYCVHSHCLTVAVWWHAGYGHIARKTLTDHHATPSVAITRICALHAGDAATMSCCCGRVRTHSAQDELGPGGDDPLRDIQVLPDWRNMSGHM